MVQINPTNILNMLLTAFYIFNILPTPVNHKKIELSDNIRQLIINSMDDFSLTIDR